MDRKVQIAEWENRRVKWLLDKIVELSDSHVVAWGRKNHIPRWAFNCL